MTSRERLLLALDGKAPDRLPVTTHDMMQSYLNTYQGGIDDQEFFRRFGFDPVLWVDAIKPDEKQQLAPPSSRMLVTCEEWKVSIKEIENQQYDTNQYTIITPKGNLTAIVQSNDYTSWLVETLIKEKRDIDIIMQYAPFYKADITSINKKAEAYGDQGIIRGTIPSFEIFGQPGCWQDLACLYGIDKLIYEVFDDPEWVHTILDFLRSRKLHYINSLAGAAFDIIELGGGDASTTVISPDIFDNFVAPYDSVLIEAANNIQQNIVYHTCGGMMPILENIVEMGPKAIETLTPPGMGGDVNLYEAKRRVGDKVCLIGGFDQGYYFTKATPTETYNAVKDAFNAAGKNGGFIISPSDHFFEAKDELLEAFTAAAKSCLYY